MKYLLLILLQVLPIQENASAIVYHMPYTELTFTIHYTMEVSQAGPFAAYASELLGIEDAIQTTDTTYYWDKVTTGTRTTADPNRVYTVMPSSDLELHYLSLTEYGTLYGYNVEVIKPKAKTTPKPTKKTTHHHAIIAPMNEETMQEGSPYNRAVAVVKQIMQIREARTYLLLGESEHQPADGMSLDVLFEQMEKEEHALLSLFLGYKYSEEMEKTIYYAPEQSTQVVLARFNPQHGIVDASEIGTPISITITTKEQQPIVETVKEEKSNKLFKSKKDDPVPTSICYNLPGSAHYLLYYGEDMLHERDVYVAQLGISIPFMSNLFKVGNSTHIILNTKTGNIESITR